MDFSNLKTRYHLDKIPHSGRTLWDHLVGVYHILCQWQERPAVRTAGLIHSIYSTDVFRVPSVALNERETIQGIVGIEAERLAYLFCAIRRSELLAAVRHGQSQTLLDRFAQDPIVVSTTELHDLGKVLQANELEQNHCL